MKAATIKVTAKYKKTESNIAIHGKKENNKSNICQRYFQIKLSILPMNHQCDIPFWKMLL